MGSDREAHAAVAHALDFNPRSPDGERLVEPSTPFNLSQFQSTLPGWGATWAVILNM